MILFSTHFAEMLEFTRSSSYAAVTPYAPKRVVDRLTPPSAVAGSLQSDVAGADKPKVPATPSLVADTPKRVADRLTPPSAAAGSSQFDGAGADKPMLSAIPPLVVADMPKHIADQSTIPSVLPLSAAAVPFKLDDAGADNLSYRPLLPLVPADVTVQSTTRLAAHSLADAKSVQSNGTGADKNMPLATSLLVAATADRISSAEDSSASPQTTARSESVGLTEYVVHRIRTLLQSVRQPTQVYSRRQSHMAASSQSAVPTTVHQAVTSSSILPVRTVSVSDRLRRALQSARLDGMPPGTPAIAQPGGSTSTSSTCGNCGAGMDFPSSLGNSPPGISSGFTINDPPALSINMDTDDIGRPPLNSTFVHRSAPHMEPCSPISSNSHLTEAHQPPSTAARSPGSSNSNVSGLEVHRSVCTGLPGQNASEERGLPPVDPMVQQSRSELGKPKLFRRFSGGGIHIYIYKNI